MKTIPLWEQFQYKSSVNIKEQSPYGSNSNIRIFPISKQLFQYGNNVSVNVYEQLQYKINSYVRSFPIKQLQYKTNSNVTTIPI